jgi:hypothetical protein
LVELLVQLVDEAEAEHYSTDVVVCGRCREHGQFRPSPAEKIVRILGYW